MSPTLDPMAPGAGLVIDPIAVSESSTVVAAYTPEDPKSSTYQSESALENELIRLLKDQGYEYLPIHTEKQLVDNLRRQLELVNDITFTDKEWQRFFRGVLASPNDTVADKTNRIHRDNIQALTRDDGSLRNIRLLDTTHIHNNRLQVINQYEVPKGHGSDENGEGGARYSNRYDVTILVNGLPMVHIELKRRGVKLKEAFNQIERYQRDSFWAGSGLFDYVQLFVISNGTETKYYSNTTREQHVKESSGFQARVAGRPPRKSSNSFEFTSWWADANNKVIRDLVGFTKTFFSRHSLLAILTRYCVLTEDGTLLVMRPYQIVAAESILQTIVAATNSRLLGTVEAGGYVWHTTGSGKTLTSFKTAQLAERLEDVDKVLFVVDRKDLDYQTMKEYDRFCKGAANSNTSTAVLARQLGDPNTRIIITTIQKLSTFIKGNSKHPVYDKHVVMIFDECHRSQFGDMHTAITKKFKRYHLFGFTGTPIFAENASSGGHPGRKTTQQAFGRKLHTYSIIDAINDGNVLPFRVDYINTIKQGDVADKDISAINRESALLAPERVEQITSYILTHFNQKTRRVNAPSYELKVTDNIAEVAAAKRDPSKDSVAKTSKRRVRGFNALFATASIEAAKAYYQCFARLQEQMVAAGTIRPDEKLRIATIFSFAPNPGSLDQAPLILDGDEEGFDTDGLAPDHREFLESAIADYNAMFGTTYDTSANSFENYYKDLSLRLKNREVDLAIVVNMFLTGFDATTMNTLFVDKNLVSHGLIQAYSRTNRILNSVKAYGNIVCFRDLEKATNDALALFGNKDAKGVVILKPYSEYYADYVTAVEHLTTTFPPGEDIMGEAATTQFIADFGKVLRLENILASFDEFAGQQLISERAHQDYQSRYLDIHEAMKERRRHEDKEDIHDDVVFELELIKQVEINIDYILAMVEQYRSRRGNGEDKEIKVDLLRKVDASPSLRNKRDLIEDFIDSISNDGIVEDQWARFVLARREEELQEIISSEKLLEKPTRDFVEDAFLRGSMRFSGEAFPRVLPRRSRFSKSSSEALTEQKQRVAQQMDEFFDRYYPLTHNVHLADPVPMAAVQDAARVISDSIIDARDFSQPQAEDVLSKLLSSRDGNVGAAQISSVAVDLAGAIRTRLVLGSFNSDSADTTSELIAVVQEVLDSAGYRITEELN